MAEYQLEYYSDNYDLCVVAKKDRNHAMRSEHFHKSYELYYVVSGSRGFFIDNKIFKLHAGALVLISSNVMHKTFSLSQEEYSNFIINFTPDVLPQFIFDDKNTKALFDSPFKVYQLEGYSLDQFQKFIRTCKTILKEKPDGFQLSFLSKFIKILHTLVILNHENKNSLDYEEANKIEKVIFEITNYINRSFQEEITLDKLSKLFYLSPSYISRSFKKYQGISLCDYINKVRISEAKNQLDYWNIPSKKLAEHCGFRSVSNFNKAFKNIIGVPPHQYRRSKNAHYQAQDQRK